MIGFIVFSLRRAWQGFWRNAMMSLAATATMVLMLMLLAGFWIWEVKDMAEAVEWVSRCPDPMLGPSEIEIRPLFEAADFGDALTPEVAELHQRNREKSAER